MANRFPLIVDTSDSNKIKELPSGDNLQLSGNDIVGVVNITGSGTLTIESISVTNITKGGTALATVATSGSYTDLSNKPTNVSAFTNDSGYVTSGSNVSVFANDAGYLTTVAFSSVTGKPTTLAGYGITDAATSTQGTKADSAVQPGANVSVLNNDAGYITLANIQNGDVTVDVNNTGDLIGSVFGDDSTILVDAVLSSINTTGTIRGHTTPHVSGVYDLGAADKQFRNAYIGGSVTSESVYLKNTNYRLETGEDGNLYVWATSTDGDVIIRTNASGLGQNNFIFGKDGNLTVPSGATITPENKTSGLPEDFTIRGQQTSGSSLSEGGNLYLDGGDGNVEEGYANGSLYLGTDSALIRIGNDGGGIVELHGYARLLPGSELDFQGESTLTNLSSITTDLIGSVFADDSTLLVDAVNGEIPGYVKIADLKTALQDGAGDYAAFKAWVLANL